MEFYYHFTAAQTLKMKADQTPVSVTNIASNNLSKKQRIFFFKSTKNVQQF